MKTIGLVIVLIIISPVILLGITVRTFVDAFLYGYKVLGDIVADKIDSLEL